MTQCDKVDNFWKNKLTTFFSHWNFKGFLFFVKYKGKLKSLRMKTSEYKYYGMSYMKCQVFEKVRDATKKCVINKNWVITEMSFP